MKKISLFLLLVPVLGTAQLQLAKIFSDNMVLQENHPVTIWGKATPGKEVNVNFVSFHKTVAAEKDSTWKVVFKSQMTSRKPVTIVVKCGKEKTELKNILIGDVWVCLGQSNMEWPVMKEMHFKEEIQNSNQPLLRFCYPK